MKRELTKQEIEQTKKGIDRLNKQVDIAKESNEYAKRKLEYLKQLWKFEDFARPLERKKSKENAEDIIKQSEIDITSITNNLIELKDHLMNGVEVKKITGVG